MTDSTAPIQTGDTIPSFVFKTNGASGPEDISTETIFKGKKVVLFAVPGAFTPGCSNTHMPGFVVHADEIKAKGVDTIACVATNDAFVMGAWQQSQNAEKILMLADGNADFTHQIGLVRDGRAGQMGLRSMRYAMIVDDGKVTYLGVDEKGVDKSSAETVLQNL